MRIKHFVAAVCVLLAGAARATPVQPGYIGDLTNAGIEISDVVGPGAFTDYFFFSVTDPSVTGTALISIPYPTSATFIDFTFLGFFDSNANLLAADVTPGEDMGPLYAPLPGPGIYALAIAGTAGPEGGIYDGFLADQVVPEPSIVALMFAGLLVAPLARRRKR